MRMLHTMLRVGNLEQSLKFYTEVLGMKLLRKRDYEEGRFTLAFVGYALIKIFTGKFSSISPAMWVVAVLSGVNLAIYS